MRRESYGSSLITKEEVQAIACPKCAAKPGEPCGERNHMERVKAARTAKGKKRQRA